MAVPTFGDVDGVVKANDPGVLALPPVRLLSANVWPKVMPLAVGAALIVGVALPTVTLALVVAVL